MAKFFPKAFKKADSDGVKRKYCQCKSCGDIWQVSFQYRDKRNGYICINCSSGKRIKDGNRIGYTVDAGVVFLIVQKGEK